MHALLPLLALSPGCSDTSETSDDTAVELTDVDGDGWATPLDCDDNSSYIHPGSSEVCNRVDDDCDGVYDDHPADGYTSWLDYDGDGFGGSDSRDTWCGSRELDARPWVFVDGDCDDADAAVNPSETESCATDGDDDCDGGVNDDDAFGCTPWFEDVDGDGVGVEESRCLCDASGSWRAETAGDCDDGDGERTEGCAGTGAHTLNEADTWFVGSPDTDRVGTAVTGPGDLDEDGYGDVALVGGGVDTMLYLVRGPFDAAEDLGTPDARYRVETALTGTSVRGGSDVDADGTADILLAVWFRSGAESVSSVHLLSGDATGVIGAPNASIDEVSSTVQAFVYAEPLADATGDGQPDVLFAGPDDALLWVFAGPWRGSVGLGDARLRVADPGATAAAATGAGDLDGDGIDELALVSTGMDGASEVSIFLGGLEGTIGLDDAEGRWTGTGGFAPQTVAPAGDIDGDGAPDLAVGGFSSFEGATRTNVRVYTGPLTTTGDLDSARATLVGSAIDAQGWQLSGPLDLDGDGFGDLAIGEPGDDTYGSSAGAVWVFYGPLDGTADHTDADWRWYGAVTGDTAGTSLAGVPDVDGDGLDELLIGVPGDDGGAPGSGAARLVRGEGR